MIQRQPVPAAPVGNVVAPEFIIAAQLVARLGRCTARLVPRLAGAAMRLARIEGWKPLGFTYANDFSRERLDRSGSWLRQLARLGQACQELPSLKNAITGADGGKPLGRVAAYEICRVACPETAADWIRRARSCTIRELKDTIRRAPNTDTSSIAATPPSRARDSLQVHLPAFLRGALLDVERVFLATNPGGRRCDFLDALIAEHASGNGAGMMDVGSEVFANRMGTTGTTGTMESTAPAAPGRSTTSGRRAPHRRLRILHGTSANLDASGMMDSDSAPDSVAETTTNRELLQARWTLHRVHMFIESLEEESSDATDQFTSSPKNIVQSMREVLALEHEIKLRIDRLLLWLEHRRAWTLLGYADAVEFGLKVLDESASTTRNRLRLARALERSAALRRGAKSGLLSHQRLVRLAQLTQHRNLDEDSLRQWVDHAAQIRLKRLDEEFDAVERRRWLVGAAAGEAAGAAGATAGAAGTVASAVGDVAGEASAIAGAAGAVASAVVAEHGHNKEQEDNTHQDPAHDKQAGPPLPLSDAEWQASLRLVPGAARRRLLMCALQTLASDAPANVCHRFTGPVATIRDLRHCFNVTRVHLAEQGRLLNQHSHQPGHGAYSPADESRLFPSIRLAARHVAREAPIPDWICLLSLLEDFAEEWDNPRNMPRRPTDAIAARDGWRCTAPGCTSREIEVHHIVYRSHGGSNDPSNLTSLCPFHHRMGEHSGLLKVTGTAPLDLRWQIGGRVFVNERLVNERSV